MKKPSFIIGKKQILLAGMTLALGIAIYINYAVSSSGNEIKSTKKVENQSVNYGDAELVNAEQGEDYFAQARIDRMTARDEAEETLKSIIGGGDSTEEEKTVASEEAAAMTGLIESESKIETLVKAAGFADCVCYLDGDNANIVVKSGSEGLVASEAAQIKDILLSEVSVPAENIRIFDVT
ncbi:MAG: SpoIIIAH-like family protein [Ruminococcus sp.]|nr:SpoIIIAH-like family protein [Ruminococcus sp.]